MFFWVFQAGLPKGDKAASEGGDEDAASESSNAATSEAGGKERPKRKGRSKVCVLPCQF